MDLWPLVLVMLYLIKRILRKAGAHLISDNTMNSSQPNSGWEDLPTTSKLQENMRLTDIGTTQVVQKKMAV